MNSVVIVILAASLLLNFVGLVAALAENKNLRRRSRYLEGAVDRAKSLAAQKDATVKRQQEEINLLSERQTELLRNCDHLRSAASGQQRKYAVLEQDFCDLQRRRQVLEKTLSEKAARLAALEQHLREKGGNSKLKAI